MRQNPFNTSIKVAPKALKMLAWFITFTSLISASLNKLFIQALNVSGTQDILSLSLEGATNHYFWQPITYLFVHPANDGISIMFLIHLFFNLYLLWSLGSLIIKGKGTKAFLRLYFISGVLAGFIGLWVIGISSSNVLVAGASPALYALMMAWTMLFPDLVVFIGHIPVKIKWLVIFFLGLTLLTDLSDGYFIDFVVYSSGALLGYLYAAAIWGLRSPFQFTHRFDQQLNNLAMAIRFKLFNIRKLFSRRKSSKIYDFQTGEILLNEKSDLK